MAKARTIQIYLPEGNPRGVKIAEIKNRTLQVVFIPRSNLDYAFSRDELDNLAVYFLVGSTDVDGEPAAYIGETEDCRARLKDHNIKKDFWQYALVVISKTKDFTKAHVKFLESYCVEQAAKAGQYKLENTVNPQRNHVPEPIVADLVDNFEDIKILTSALGYKLFDIMEKAKKEEILYCKGKDADAMGKYAEDGLTVFAGSKCQKETTNSCHRHLINKRLQLIDEGVVQEKEDVYILKFDYTFSSPSTAAGIVLARSANGWIEWKYKNGKTLDEVKRPKE